MKELELRIKLAEFLQPVIAGDKSEGRRLIVDVDGTLCEGEAWTLEQMRKAKPIWEVISIVNDIYGRRNYEIYIWTARGNLANETMTKEQIWWTTYKWLIKHWVRFHKLDINKIGYTFMLDDKTFNPRKILDGR